MKLTHGGDWFGYRQRYDHAGLDFSANVSPLGLSEGVAKASADSLSNADRYPDPLCRELREALAEHEAVPAEHILCGNGAADLSFRFALALCPRRGLLCAPTFAEYRTALETAECEVDTFYLLEQTDFQLPEAFLEHITPETDVVFLCQPNNPTGRLVEPELMRRVLRRCRELGTFLAVDECFLDFLPNVDRLSMKSALGESDHLIIFKAFTKLYAMAGLRLGYCMSRNTALLEQMQRVGQPWSASSVAQAAGVAALKESDYVARVRALVAQQRPIVRQGLERLGLRVVPGEANFLLFRASEDLGERLEKRGVILRNCANFPGLGAGWYRTAIRTAEENRLLLQAIEEELG